jgi:peptidoglycan/LPS O-acetylase OafA/YrhL
MKSLNIGYIPAVDHLRAFAALLIFFYHSVTLVGYRIEFGEPFAFQRWKVATNPVSALLFEGHTAVSLFMVLSGFIFTIGAYQSQVRYVEFVRNRFLRTYPLFLLMLFTGIYSYSDHFNVAALLQSLLFMGNLPGAVDAGAFSSMFWAVAVEWQFYLVFPFLMLFVNRHGVRYAFGLLLIFVALRCCAALLGANVRDLSYWTIIGRMDQFLLGMVAGVMYCRHFRAGVLFDALFVVSVVLMFTLMYAFNQAGGWPAVGYYKIVWPTVEGLMWSCFILGYISVARLLPGVVSKALIAIGTISYSMYLIHFVVVDICIRQQFFVLVPGADAMQNALYTALLYLLPMVLLLSTFTYHVVEKPFLQLRHAYVDKG